MKKVSFICLFLTLCIALNIQAQTSPPTDFFAGKWEVTIKGTPQGDSKMLLDLVRTDGKMTGQLSNVGEPTAEKMAVAVEENGTLLELAFNTQGYDVTINLKKENDDNLKGTLMGMYDTSAIRVK